MVIAAPSYPVPLAETVPWPAKPFVLMAQLKETKKTQLLLGIINVLII
jgi:hypothetical protein